MTHFFSIHKQKKGFTLFELSIGITIFASLMIAILASVSYISVARQKSESRILLLQELYFFSEQLVSVITDGGTLDYEEYWNRITYDTQTESGHYRLPTGMGNYGRGGDLRAIGGDYGSGNYLCRSGNGVRMGTGGCASDTQLNDVGISLTGKYQRYGQYALQYMNYNENADSDNGMPGDEDGDGKIVGDEDDRDIGDGPSVISGSLTELYMINESEKTRTYLRYIVRDDPNHPERKTCTQSGTEWIDCLGNVQILKMKGLDRGMLHSGSLSDTGAFDGLVDTWICHRDWKCAGPSISPNETIATGTGSEWVDLFPDTINVKNISFRAFPEKNPWRSWSAVDTTTSPDPNFVTPFIHPYVKLKLTLGFAWSKRNLQLQKTDDPTISIVTSINLSDL